MVKKINHNATERDRRKKINSLYSSLHSLLPVRPEQKKKLSIPATISRVLKYIPELQGQIQQLTQQKERLLSCASADWQGDSIGMGHNRNDPAKIAGSSDVVSMSWLSESEAAIQICQVSPNNGLAEILLDLENNGFSLTSASSFKSTGTGGKIFHNLHVRVGRDSTSQKDEHNQMLQDGSFACFGSEFFFHELFQF